MYVMTLNSSEGKNLLCIILLDEDISRIKTFDPATLPVERIPMQSGPIADIYVAYATAEDVRLIIDWVEKGDTNSVLKHLTRGYTWRPDLGDGIGAVNMMKKGEGNKPN